MRHFIDLADWSSEDLQAMLDLALQLKEEWKQGGNAPVLKGKVLGLIFEKPSLRTRVSFEIGMQQLGGSALTLGPSEIGFGKRESVADITRVIERYMQIVMARVFDHKHLVEMTRWSSIPVINGLSDLHHPCQALADMLTIREKFGTTKGLRVCFVGDGNNVAASLMQMCAHTGANFAIATPPGYELPEESIDSAMDIAQRNGATIELYHTPEEALRGAQVVYTDTWVSMGQEAQSTPRIHAMRPYQVNDKLLQAAESDAIVMHCLPAHRGQEITDEVADGPQSVIFDQAENRMHAQKAVLVTLLA